MARARILEGKMTHRDESPDWKPLLGLVGDELARDFMWMFEVQLSDESSIQAYKHIDTRRYIHLNVELVAFAYEPPDRYRQVDAADVLAEVFMPLPGLAGVTAQQIQASWRVVERLASAQGGGSLRHGLNGTL